MRLTPMRFKDFTWPHNPEVYTMEYRRRLAVHRVPFGPCVLQDLGSAYRVLRGKGAFVGDNAYGQFRALAEIFEQEGPGLLVHPVWQTERAYFASLAVTEEPLPDYVQYAFEFWEDWGGYDGGLKEQSGGGTGGNSDSTAKTVEAQQDYIVKKGDTLWAIAKRHNVALQALVAANPQIKNPNLIYPGDGVKIP